MTATPDLKALLKPNDLVVVAQLGAEPTGLTDALFAVSHEIPGLRVLTSFPLGAPEARMAATDVEFIAMDGFGANGKLFLEGRLGIAPARFSDYWRLFDRSLKPDVALCSVTPPDADGNVSLGVTVDHMPHVISRARVALAEINPAMPWTNGDGVLPLSVFHGTMPAPAPPGEWTARAPGPVDHAVAAHVARLVPDRATVQYGVGSLPDAVAAALASKRDLGMHSGSLADSFVDLIEAGAISNRYKEIDPGMNVATALYGSRRLYDHVDRNADLVMRAGAYTHGAATLANFETFFAINSALEVDLTGQVGAEAAGKRYLGAIGGQLDFHRAGVTSANGRAIIALGSTAGKARATRIVHRLSGPVTGARADADTVVTEHGVAELLGLTLGERAEALIAIADPEHRTALREAVQRDGLT
ncbi:MAG: acetyl-CoA hydrolase/transferase family protein [Alphaproteobacteria bacterium]